MSNERQRPDDLTDPLVSQAFRELANERTPEHLDHVVLNEARSAAKVNRRKTIAWLRPAAWVATIGLCLAIVLEIAEMAVQEEAIHDSPVNDLERSTAEPSAADAAPAPAPSTVRQDPAAAIEIESLATDDAQLIREAENRARLQAGSSERSANIQLQAAPAAELAGDAAVERHCDETQTADPETWLECILKLEQEGFHEAARLERELLAEAFPPPEVRQ